MAIPLLVAAAVTAAASYGSSKMSEAKAAKAARKLKKLESIEDGKTIEDTADNNREISTDVYNELYGDGALIGKRSGVIGGNFKAPKGIGGMNGKPSPGGAGGDTNFDGVGAGIGIGTSVGGLLAGFTSNPTDNPDYINAESGIKRGRVERYLGNLQGENYGMGDLVPTSGNTMSVAGGKHGSGNDTDIDRSDGSKFSIEAGEVIQPTDAGLRVFSDRFGINGGQGTTFARMADKISKQKGDLETSFSKTVSPIGRNTKQREIDVKGIDLDKLFGAQESMKTEGAPTETFGDGGTAKTPFKYPDTATGFDSFKQSVETDGDYKDKARLFEYKSKLDTLLRASDPNSFDSLAKENYNKDYKTKAANADKYYAEKKTNAYINQDSIKSTLGDDYTDYISLMDKYHKADLGITGKTESGTDVSKFKYGLRTSSVIGKPSVGVGNKKPNSNEVKSTYGVDVLYDSKAKKYDYKYREPVEYGKGGLEDGTPGFITNDILDKAKKAASGELDPNLINGFVDNYQANPSMRVGKYENNKFKLDINDLIAPKAGASATGGEDKPGNALSRAWDKDPIKNMNVVATGASIIDNLYNNNLINKDAAKPVDFTYATAENLDAKYDTRLPINTVAKETRNYETFVEDNLTSTTQRVANVADLKTRLLDKVNDVNDTANKFNADMETKNKLNKQQVNMHNAQTHNQESMFNYQRSMDTTAKKSANMSNTISDLLKGAERSMQVDSERERYRTLSKQFDESGVNINTIGNMADKSNRDEYLTMLAATGRSGHLMAADREVWNKLHPDQPITEADVNGKRIAGKKK